MPPQIGNATSEKMLLFGGPNPSSHLVSETTMLSYPSSHLAFNSRRVQMSHPYNDSYGSYKLKRRKKKILKPTINHIHGHSQTWFRCMLYTFLLYMCVTLVVCLCFTYPSNLKWGFWNHVLIAPALVFSPLKFLQPHSWHLFASAFQFEISQYFETLILVLIWILDGKLHVIKKMQTRMFLLPVPQQLNR